MLRHSDHKLTQPEDLKMWPECLGQLLRKSCSGACGTFLKKTAQAPVCGLWRETLPVPHQLHRSHLSKRGVPHKQLAVETTVIRSWSRDRVQLIFWGHQLGITSRLIRIQGQPLERHVIPCNSVSGHHIFNHLPVSHFAPWLQLAAIPFLI